MGKFLEKFKKNKQDKENLKNYNPDNWSDAPDGDMFDDDFNYNDNLTDPYSDNIIPAQKPESFHHFILENQYKDLERSIRGFKDVYNKDTREWEIKRKSEHCFTDEEAEEILRTAQSHLATDIKLGFVSKESFPLLMNAIYKELAFLFESIAEYRYGRYGDEENNIKWSYKIIKSFRVIY